ncbi:MAG: hypothetical protein COC20_07605, partial [Cellvibrionales bacterium]
MPASLNNQWGRTNTMTDFTEIASGLMFPEGPVAMPDGMKENDRFPEPLLTPTTKEDVGHDEDISREDILSQGLVSEADYVQLEDFTRKLFQRGTEIAADMGLILVDTKYEFGKDVNGVITLIDEIHTPDSSRYFYKEGYQARQDT